MKKIIICMSAILLFLSGCMGRGKNDRESLLGQYGSKTATFTRSVQQISLEDGFNPFVMRFSENGIYYYVTRQTDDGPDDERRLNEFYYQSFSGDAAVKVCAIKNELVRDFSVFIHDNEERLLVYSIGEKASINEYNQKGILCKKIKLDDAFSEVGELPIVGALTNGNYVIAKNTKIYLLNSDGKLIAEASLNGRVSSILPCRSGDAYMVFEKSENGKQSFHVAQMNPKTAKISNERSVPNGGTKVFLFEEDDGVPIFCTAAGGYLTLFDMQNGEKNMMDLNRQGLLASQMQYVFGTWEEPQILLLDETQPQLGAFMLRMKETEEDPETAGKSNSKKEKDLYAPDGRKILQVAISEDYVWSMEFHAKKYNLISENAMIEVERFQGTLEDYLGKGNRPDVIVFEDQTDMEAYVEKQVLLNLTPLFEKQERYSLEGIIPKARELLGVNSGDEMYAMSGRFELLLRCSDGTEYDERKQCSAVEYLKWYDRLLTENELSGCGDISKVLFAVVCDFYDVDQVQADFLSDDFKDLMKAYKETLNRHKGELETQIGSGKGYLLAAMAEAPRWYKAYLSAGLSDASASLEGLPMKDGGDMPFMLLEYPMGILRTSENAEEALDFIMYYCTLEEYLGASSPEGEYGKKYSTRASFFVYGEALNKQIFETEQPFLTLRGNLSSGNASERFKEYYYTEEQKENLRRLIDSAVPVTKAQKVIFGMLMEEMAGYFHGGQSLDAACEILQNRVELYLNENM